MKTLQTWFIYLIVSMLFVVCQHSAVPDPAPAAKITDYGVYSAIIDQYCPAQPSAQRLYLTDDQTIKPDNALEGYINDSYAQDSISRNPAWQQFVRTIDSSQFSIHSISDSISSVCYRVQPLTAQQKAAYFAPGSTRSLEELKNEFPDFRAVLRFSSIVYSTNGLKAVCYRVTYCGFDCAEGSAYLLERRSTGWKVVKDVAIWTT